MQPKLTQSRKVLFLALLCTSCFLVGYITRQNYSAVLVEIIAKEGYSKPAASAALTGLFVTYGLGQIASGYLCAYIRPAKVVGFGLFLSSAMNVLIPFCGSAAAMTAVWAVNGFAQAMLWLPMMQIMSELFTLEEYQRKSFWISYSSHIGTMAVYFIASVILKVSGWRSVFFVCAGIGLAATAFWFWGIRKVEGWAAPVLPSRARKQPESPVSGSGTVLKGTLIFWAVIMIAITIQGILRDGIHSWMPTIYAETFHVDSSSAVFSSMIAPVFSMVCSVLTPYLYRNWLKNELVASAAIFGIIALACGIVYLLSGSSAIALLALLSLASGFASGVNVLLIIQVPAHFRNGCISSIGGILNSFTYVGSCISSYGIAVVTEHSGWNTVLLLWSVAAAAGMLLCLALLPRWSVFRKRS